MSGQAQDRGSEHAEPHELYNPVPRIVIGLALALVAWAAGYIWTARPDAAAGLGDRREPALLAAAAASGSGAAADGRQLYVGKCQACHQAAGQGLPGVFPPLAGSPWVTGEGALTAQILLHGLTGPVEVAGARYDGAMPAFGAQMNDAELAAVLSFVRSSWGNQAAAVDAEAIRAARALSAQRSAPWNIAELQQALAAAPRQP